MRFGYMLLRLVALTSLHASSGQVCTNGFAGVQNDDICCPVSCGTCGGGGCASRTGGSDSCCTSRVRESGMLCSDTQAAPCIVNNDDMCSNGLLGVQNGDICCGADCVTCGGRRCGGRVGGADSCCTSRVRDTGVFCSDTMAAPCIVNDDVFCSNGVNGVEKDGICCEAQCGTCGGFGCRTRPGGENACCTGVIEDSGMFCSNTTMSPCIIASDEPSSGRQR